jgi:hypothetical protein
VHHDDYATLRVSREAGIARVTLDNPPVPLHHTTVPRLHESRSASVPPPLGDRCYRMRIFRIIFRPESMRSTYFA